MTEQNPNEDGLRRHPLTAKSTNPKDAVGTGKAPYSTISAQVMAEVGVAMLEGARKYGRHNYRVAGVRASVYYDAVVARHLGGWWEGEDLDPDSGLSHITKAIAGLMVLRDSMLQGNWVDDRPPRAADPDWLNKLNAKVREIVAKYPDPPEPYTELGLSAADRRPGGCSPCDREDCCADREGIPQEVVKLERAADALRRLTSAARRANGNLNLSALDAMIQKKESEAKALRMKLGLPPFSDADRAALDAFYAEGTATELDEIRR